MMLPNQITLQHFTQTGKGGYRSLEVDAFLQRVYQSYNKLYNDNKALNDKLEELMPQIEEYNRSKTTIADALIWAKSTAEKNIEEAKAISENLVADATAKADKLLEDKKMEADTYYADKTMAANRNLEKAKSELESIKQQSAIFSDRYIAEINVKTQTIIEDANSKAASIVADAYADAKKAREKADRIIADANAELEMLKAEAIKIKNEMYALISYAQTAAEKVSSYSFDAFEKDEGAESEVLEAKSIDFDEIQKFSFDGIQQLTVEEEAQPEEAPVEESKPAQPEYVRFFGADIPDVNDILSGIFAAGNKNNNEDENSFRFEKVVSDFDRPSEIRTFDILGEDDDE